MNRRGAHAVGYSRQSPRSISRGDRDPRGGDIGIDGIGPRYGSGHRIVDNPRPVHVKLDTRLVARVEARNLDDGRRDGRALALYLDLGAVEEELGAAEVSRAVDANVLDTDQVLAGRGLLGEGEGEVANVGHTPLDAVAGELLRAEFPDLEPVAGAIVLAHITGSLGQVDLHRSGVLNQGVEVGSESELVAGLDLVDSRLAGKVLGARVASKIGAFVAVLEGM